MKSVLLSVNPKWCEKICNEISKMFGKPLYEKGVEIRKTKPNLETPFKGLIYCTKAKGHFSIGGGVYATNDTLYRLPTGEIKFGDGFELMGDWSGQYDENNFLNGKVIGEFVCDIICDIPYTLPFDSEDNCHSINYSVLVRSCLTLDEIDEYLGKKGGYGWHISNLVIYDKPKELCEFSKAGFGHVVPLKRPPQSWMYVEVPE